MTQDSSASRSGQGASAMGSSQSTTGTGTSSDLASQAKEAAKQVASQAQDKMSGVADQAREQVGTQLSGQKERVAESLGGVAQMLRQTGQQMRDQDQHGFTGYIDRAASQVESFSTYLRQNDMGRLVDDVEHFARREPVLFLGGAFLLGLLGARFMKSSRPQPRYENQYRPYYTGYASSADYTPGTGYTGMGTTGTGYTGTSGTTGYGPETKSGFSSTTGQGSTGQGSQRGAGIYDKDREGS